MSVYGFSAGTQIYKYRLVKELGSSQGDVWLAQDCATNKQVALKFLDGANRPVAERLWEAQIGARFRHPNLCEVLYADVVSIGATSFVAISQTYYQHGACTRQLQGPGVLPAKSVQKLLMDVLMGLEYLHQNAVYHNDLKPANILVSDHGDYVITDYGISYSLASGAKPISFYQPHVPPETITNNRHDPCVLSDIYQLGLTAYRLLNGLDEVVSSFTADPTAFRQGVAAGTIPDRDAFSPFLPASLRRIVCRAIEADPIKRYQGALEMRRDLERTNIPIQWTYDLGGNLNCITNNASYVIDEQYTNAKEAFVRCKKTFQSGHQVFVADLSKRCKLGAQVAKQKKVIYQWVLRNG
jgi:eukaryotic-like serine/threonine-protein kinase